MHVVDDAGRVASWLSAVTGPTPRGERSGDPDRDLWVAAFAIAGMHRIDARDPVGMVALTARALDSLSQTLVRRLHLVAHGGSNASDRDLDARVFDLVRAWSSAVPGVDVPPKPHDGPGWPPVLARLLAVITEGFVSWVRTLRRRVDRDLVALQATHGRGGRPLGAIDAVEVPVWPANMECVAGIVTFVGGPAIRYAPLDGPAEGYLNDLLRWVNAAAGRALFRVVRSVVAGDCAWTEHLESEPPATSWEIDRLFDGIGMLTCVASLLNGRFGVPFGTGCSDDRVPTPAGFHLEWEAGIPSEHWVDPLASAAWLAPNAAVWDASGAPHSAYQHRHQIEAGFIRIYRLLARRREALLARGGPTDALRSTGCAVRLRLESRCDRMRRRLLEPRLVQDPVRWRSELEALVRSVPYAGGPYEPILKSDRVQLANLNHPIHRVAADSTTVVDDVTADRLALPGRSTAFAHARRRIERLSARQVRAEVYDLRHILAAQVVARNRSVSTLTECPAETDFRVLAEREAERIADDLLDLVVGHRRHRPIWLAPSGATSLRPMQAVDESLFQGTAGIALFFAARAATGGKAEHRAIAEQWVESMAARRRSSRGLDGLQREIGSHGIRGCAGVAYALATIGRLLDDDRAHDVAADVARHLSLEQGVGDGEYDVIGGIAGTALALTALYASAGDRSVLRKAVECGERLLAARVVDRHTGVRVWNVKPGADDRRFMGTGFAHGSSGIAAALASILRYAPDQDLRDALAEILRFESLLYIPAERNWHDVTPPVRAHASNRFLMRAWCHGAVGIGLSRLAIAPIVETDWSTFEACLEAPTGRGRGPLETKLCCGVSGHVELLLTAGLRLGEPRYRARAEETCRVMVRQECERARDGSCPASVLMGPSLFHGVAGIGYQLLRVAFPSVVPNVLLLE
jgi:lantibiotic modifying enzyme